MEDTHLVVCVQLRMLLKESHLFARVVKKIQVCTCVLIYVYVNMSVIDTLFLQVCTHLSSGVFAQK